MNEGSTPPNELLKENWLSLSQAAKLFPSGRKGRPVSASCIWRWFRQGVTLPDGRIVKLEALKVVNRYVTSREAVQRFVAAQQPISEVIDEVLPSEKNAGSSNRTAAKRQRESEHALDQLLKGGRA